MKDFSFKIRLAGGDDLAALNALAMAHGYQEADYFARCFAAAEERRRWVFLAEAGGQSAGCAVLNRQSRYQPFRSAEISEMQDLFVLPDWRRHGLGAALIEASEAQARRDGGTMIGLAVGLHKGYGAAQRLYVRLGYQPDGFGVVYDMQPVRPGEARPVDDDLCLMMVKALKPE